MHNYKPTAEPADINTQTHVRTHNYDESGWIFVMTGLTEPLVIGVLGKGRDTNM